MTRILALTIFLAACGSSDGVSSPQAECNDLAASMCSRFYTCLTPQEQQAAGLPATEAQCDTQYEQQLSCSAYAQGAACPTGKTYHADQADLCVQQVGDVDCSVFTSGSFDVNTAAPACAKVCS